MHNPLTALVEQEMVLDTATADAIRQALSSTECAACGFPQKGGLLTPPETELARLWRDSLWMQERSRLLRWVWLLAGIAIALALALVALLPLTQ